VMGPGTNDHHTKSLTLIWWEPDIRTALVAGKDRTIGFFCTGIFLKIFNLSHHKKHLRSTVLRP